MKFFLFLIAFIATPLIANTINEPAFNRCHLLKLLRDATRKKLHELAEKAEDGDSASVRTLILFDEFCKRNKKSSTIISYKLGDFTFDDHNCECLSEEVYNECKEVFEDEEKEIKSYQI